MSPDSDSQDPGPLRRASGATTCVACAWTTDAVGELVQVHYDRDIAQASHDELPVIDIHAV